MAAALENKSTTPTITAKSGDLARTLKVLSGKAGGGNPAFDRISIARNAVYISAEYRTQDNEIAIIARINAEPANPSEVGEIATNDPARLLSYIDGGLFDTDSTISLSQPDNDTLRINGGRKNITMRGFNPSEVPRTAFENAFGRATGGFFVSTNPEVRPVDGSAWETWTSAGYAVFQIQRKTLNQILTAGALIQKNYKAACITLDFDGNALRAKVQESQESNEDCVDIGELDGVVPVANSPPISIGIRYSLADPAWSALGLLETENVMMIHHPSEGRVNFAVVADGFAVTYIVARTSKDTDIPAQ